MGMRLLPMFIILLMLSSTMPISSPDAALSEVDQPSFVPANLKSYDLYLDSPNETISGDGSIVTKEPSGAHEEESAVGGLEFRSRELISDLTIYGSGSGGDKIELNIYLKFEGGDGSTADLTFTLQAGNADIASETKTLNDPCDGGGGFPPGGGDCSWTSNEIFFTIDEDGYQLSKGSQLRLTIDASIDCQGGGGIGGGGASCDVIVAYGDIESTDGTSRLELKANALAESTVKAHAPGSMWTDPEMLEWAPNHRSDSRTIQFSIDVRDAFGREDIQSVSLVMETPTGENAVFDKDFEDDDLKLDNNGLVGNYTWTYDEGIAAGHYPLKLQIRDVQGHTVEFDHAGIDFVEYAVYLALPMNHTGNILIAPGKTSSVEFMIQHTGAAGLPINVEMMLVTALPSSWSDEVWDKPAGYELSGGGAFVRPILTLQAPDGDLSTAPERLEIRARATVDDDDGIPEEVALEVIVLTVEEVDVFSPPRISIYEDVEHQRQIADSNRPEAYDAKLSHYIDSESEGIYFVDVFNTGFDSDKFKIKVEDIPDGWQYLFSDNGTGLELETEGVNAITPSIASHELMTMVMRVYPPSDRDASNLGLVELRVTSAGDSDLTSEISFTVHRTFGILAEVIADSDAGDLGVVGPVDPGSSISYQIRITDSTNSGGQNTWKVVSPDKLTANTDVDSSYAAWTFALSDDNDTSVVVINLRANETFDLELAITMTEQVLAGNHTLYLRVIEEGVDSDEARYFDLPVMIKVGEVVTPGSIFVERKTAISSFLPLQSKNIEFLVENTNNIPLDIVITANAPNGWDIELRTNANQIGQNFVILSVPAFSQNEFTMVITAPDNIRSGDDFLIELEVTPMDDEIPYPPEYTQNPLFSLTSTCEGFNCAINQIVNPSSQTIGLFVALGLIVLLAIYRKGAQSAVGSEEKTWAEDDEDLEEISLDIPAPVTDDEDLTDDLELLDELDDL
jgi:uncharacterized membrane protein